MTAGDPGLDDSDHEWVDLGEEDMKDPHSDPEDNDWDHVETATNEVETDASVGPTPTQGSHKAPQQTISDNSNASGNSNGFPTYVAVASTSTHHENVRSFMKSNNITFEDYDGQFAPIYTNSFTGRCNFDAAGPKLVCDLGTKNVSETAKIQAKRDGSTVGHTQDAEGTVRHLELLWNGDVQDASAEDCELCKEV